ncbi:hypothetical protein BD779DRAFT_1681686 [Infundibulicybe gibba]|nr:hypothetical protein BD779DRAFT_1681686 [Infundibulicybe gibba]
MAKPPPNVCDTGSNPASTSETTASPLVGDIRDNPSARAVALITEDILRQIFSHFDTTANSNDTADKRITLLHAALVCKAFMEPALDALWRSTSSIMPAMKLLSLNLQTIEGTNNIFTFPNDPSERRWARFDYHSKRVREFRCYSAPAQEMTTAALLYLSRYRPVIFPHLRNVIWTTSMSPFVMLLMSPTLRSLDITGVKDDDPGVLTTLLSVLPRSVTQISLRGSIPKTCMDLVSKISSLSTLILPKHDTLLSHTSLCSLGALTGLECLHININISLFFLGDINFPALRILCISGWFDSIYKFVTTLASTQISLISISSTSWNIWDSGPTRGGREAVRGHLPGPEWCSREPPDFQGLLKFIAARWRRLNHLDFDLFPMTPKYPDTTSYTLLQPFHNWHSLKTISIRGFSRLPSSNQDLIDMGTSWPMVRTLVIPFSPSPTAALDSGSKSGTRTPTTLGLRLLAKLCPSLTTLQLSIDVQDLPALTDEPLSHGLQTLSVGDSPIGDPVLVAKHLDCIFPYLKTVSGSKPVVSLVAGAQVAADPTRDGWKLVERILHNCQARCADEHKRAKAREAGRKFSTNAGHTSVIP